MHLSGRRGVACLPGSLPVPAWRHSRSPAQPVVPAPPREPVTAKRRKRVRSSRSPGPLNPLFDSSFAERSNILGRVTHRRFQHNARRPRLLAGPFVGSF